MAPAQVALWVIWGSTYLAIDVAVESLPPFGLVAARSLAAGALLYGVARASGSPRPSLQDWKYAAGAGILLFVVGHGSLFWAQQRVASGHAAIAFASLPAWITAIAWGAGLVPRPSRTTVAGIALGFLGIWLLFRGLPGIGGAGAGAGAAGSEAGVRLTGDGAATLDPLGGAALLLSVVAWAAGSLVRDHTRRPPLLLSTGMSLLAGGAVLVLISLMGGESSGFRWAETPGPALVAFAYLVLFGSVTALALYFWLLRYTTPARASSFAYVTPAVAVILGWAFRDEALTGTTLASLALILTGVALLDRDRTV